MISIILIRYDCPKSIFQVGFGSLMSVVLQHVHVSGSYSGLPSIALSDDQVVCWDDMFVSTLFLIDCMRLGIAVI